MDQSLATEVLPPPPPIAFIKLPLNKRPGDLKRPLPSFLPSSDPGTTYSTHGFSPAVVGGGPTTGGPDDKGRRKRARTDKGPFTRPQRNANAASRLLPTPPTSTPPTSDPSGISAPPVTPAPAGTSTPPVDDLPIDANAPTQPSDTAAKKGGRPKGPKGKGKAKTGDAATMEIDGDQAMEDVYEEPFPNDDICAACHISHTNSNASTLSHFLYCDGCPRSFHLGCLDPPLLDMSEAPEAEWFCASCKVKKQPPPKPPARAGPFDLLLHRRKMETPSVFQLPDDIRSTFKDVSTAPKGIYVDSGEIRTGRANRHGFLEDRDPYPIKDRNGNLITCFKCNGSATAVFAVEDTLPLHNVNGRRESTSGRRSRTPNTTTTTNIMTVMGVPSSGRRMLECDYCHMYWHLDCLDPPMAVIPPATKKWMCPIHIEHLLPQRRVFKTPAPVVEVKARRQRNNGNIEVVPSADYAFSSGGKELYEEVWINARKYMIPEKTIRLDFWDKASERRNGSDRKPLSSPREEDLSSSPLTELSSLDDDDVDEMRLDVEATPIRKTSNPPSSVFSHRYSQSPEPDDMDTMSSPVSRRISAVNGHGHGNGNGNGNGNGMEVDFRLPQSIMDLLDAILAEPLPVPRPPTTRPGPPSFSDPFALPPPSLSATHGDGNGNSSRIPEPSATYTLPPPTPPGPPPPSLSLPPPITNTSTSTSASSSSIKPGSTATSFKIRIPLGSKPKVRKSVPDLAINAEDVNAMVPGTGIVGEMVNGDGQSVPPDSGSSNIPPLLTTTSATVGSATATAPGPTSLSQEEIGQLLEVRTLMLAAGREKLLAFLTSSTSAST